MNRPRQQPSIKRSLNVRFERKALRRAGLHLHVLDERPKTRGDCPTERPCPWAGCKYHLALYVSEHGSLVVQSPEVLDGDFSRLVGTCTLDFADRPATLDEVGTRLGVTRERVRQLEERALLTLFFGDDVDALRGDEEP